MVHTFFWPNLTVAKLIIFHFNKILNGHRSNENWWFLSSWHRKFFQILLARNGELLSVLYHAYQDLVFRLNIICMSLNRWYEYWIVLHIKLTNKATITYVYLWMSHYCNIIRNSRNILLTFQCNLAGYFAVCTQAERSRPRGLTRVSFQQFPEID